MIDLDRHIPYKEYYLARIAKAKRTGQDQLSGCCPFHDDQKNSFSVNTKSGKWKCFANAGCGEGNIVTFHAKRFDLSTKDATADLCKIYNVPPECSASKPKPKKTIPIKTLDRLSIPKGLRDYLVSVRGWSPEVVEKYRIGYHAKRQRVTIPIFDECGDLVNIRMYLPKPGLEENKFEAWKAGFGNMRLFPLSMIAEARAKNQILYLVEGEPDCLCGISRGMCCITGTGGAENWLDEWNALFKGLHVRILYDNDQAGKDGTARVCQRLPLFAKKVEVGRWPEWVAERGDLGDWFMLSRKAVQDLDCLSWVHSDDVEKPSDSYPATDLGNAERFASQHVTATRYCHTWGKWLVWDDARWYVDGTSHVFQLAKSTVRSIYAEASKIESDELRKSFAKHARASEASGRIQAMLSLAQAEPSLAITSDVLDADRWRLNLLNGTLDLKTGDLRPHQRQDLITKISPVIYDSTAKCPEWFKFLDRIMDGSSELISYLQKLAGYCLTGDTREKCLPVLHGIGDNGKTIFTATLSGMLGDYAQETPVETLMVKRNESIPNDVARLVGARLVTASEGERGQRLAESQIKRLTGGDKVPARFLNHEWFEFIPEFKILLSTNHKPVIRGSDNAIWNRIHLVPFQVSIPKSEQIPRTIMLDTLRMEWPGILKWAVDGCLLWQKEGLQKPEEVKQATDDYRADSDVIGEYLSDCCILNPLAKAKIGDLYVEYEKWCADCKEEAITVRSFSSTLQERGFKKGRMGAGGKKGFFGIGLRSDLKSDRVTDSDSISGVYHEAKNKEEIPLKTGTPSVTRSLFIVCSDCANFRENTVNPSFQGHCLGTPPDEDRSRFPKLKTSCCGFKEKK